MVERGRRRRPGGRCTRAELSQRRRATKATQRDRKGPCGGSKISPLTGTDPRALPFYCSGASILLPPTPSFSGPVLPPSSVVQGLLCSGWGAEPRTFRRSNHGKTKERRRRQKRVRQRRSRRQWESTLCERARGHGAEGPPLLLSPLRVFLHYYNGSTPAINGHRGNGKATWKPPPLAVLKSQERGVPLFIAAWWLVSPSSPLFTEASIVNEAGPAQVLLCLDILRLHQQVEERAGVALAARRRRR